MKKAMKEMQLEQLAVATSAVSIKKLRRKRQKKIVAELLSDYASNSTLHGLRYVTAKELTLCEKAFWLTTFFISIAMCGYLINNVYIKWRTSPVIISVSERMVSVNSVPFPSVTICPQVKSMASAYNVSAKRFQMKEMLKNRSLDSEDVEWYEDISLICGEGMMDGFESNELKTNRNYTNDDIVDRIRKVSPIYHEFMLDCWLNNLSCIGMFNRVLTSEGVCFNINGLAADEIFSENIQSHYNYTESDQRHRGWSFATGYDKHYNKSDQYPIRGSDNGARPNLQVLLYTDVTEKDVLCNGINSGFKIYMSHPADLPQSSLYYYAAIDGQLSSLAVSVHVLKTSETLNGYSAKDRQCYFPEDHELRYFKLYTLKNCQAECLSKYTYKLCGCVGYYMPHDTHDRICTIKSQECMQNAKDIMASEELRHQLDNGNGGCQCLPACFSVEYDAEILKTEFKMSDVLNRDWIERYNETFDDKRYKLSKIDVYFKKPEFVSMRRSELFGVTDFIANIGGLLGVFLGFSFLSLVEIIYFFTLRIGFTLRRDLKNEKKNMKHA